MTKFVRTLIIINGLIIPTTLLVILVLYLINTLNFRSYDHDPVKVENVITKDGDTLTTQGLQYGTPESISNSTNLIIKVGSKSFRAPKHIDSYEGGSLSKSMESEQYYVNVLFLDKNYNVIKTLLYKKASILQVNIPEDYGHEKKDTTIKNICYSIAFEDTNKDNLIDADDDYDLFISDLSGNELHQVTHGIDIEQYDFINNHSELLISFTDRNDNIKDEHKIKRFAKYDIRSQDFKILTNIDKALISIQKTINK